MLGRVSLSPKNAIDLIDAICESPGLEYKHLLHTKYRRSCAQRGKHTDLIGMVLLSPSEDRSNEPDDGMKIMCV